MAKYLGSITTDIRGKLGGVVYTAHGNHRVIRSKAYPIASPSGQTGTPLALFATATQEWYAMGGSDNVGWTDAVAYNAYQQGLNPDLVQYNTFQGFAGAWAMGQAIGIVPVPTGRSFPLPPPTATYATIGYSGGIVTASPFIGADAYTGSYAISIIVGPIGPISKPPTTGYSIMGGSNSGGPIDITAAWLAAFGQPPSVGQPIFVEIDTLWPDWLIVWASVYINTKVG